MVVPKPLFLVARDDFWARNEEEGYALNQ